MTGRSESGPVTVLAFVTVNEHDPAAVARYQSAAHGVLRAVGARLVRRFRLTGPTPGARATWVGVVEYPDADAVRAVFDSGAYARLSPLRSRAFSSVEIRVAGNAAPALSRQLP